MKRIVLLGLVLIGCQESDIPDQCLRREIFNECLAHVPNGPTHVVTNDWDEVIELCNNSAYVISFRRKSTVPRECR